jgi:hypothetical protein
MSDSVLPDLLGHKDPGGDGNDVPRIQPRPLRWWVVRRAGRTVITRVWRPGDVSRCGLCPRGTCNAALDVCVIVAPRPVADAPAALYSLRPGRAPR